VEAVRSSDLRKLQPFFAAVEGYVGTLARDTSRCRCELDAAGRWDVGSERSCVGRDGCRQILHLVVRAHLAQLRLNVEHITDPELDIAVGELRALCLKAADMSAQDFTDGVQRALHSERVEVL
jgi:hypothetical protein